MPGVVRARMLIFLGKKSAAEQEPIQDRIGREPAVLAANSRPTKQAFPAMMLKTQKIQFAAGMDSIRRLVERPIQRQRLDSVVGRLPRLSGSGSPSRHQAGKSRPARLSRLPRRTDRLALRFASGILRGNRRRCRPTQPRSIQPRRPLDEGSSKSPRSIQRAVGDSDGRRVASANER